jgi:hypothetical protein
MTRSQANRIQEIIRSQDVRDPRNTLDAIKAVLDENPGVLPKDHISEVVSELIKSLREETEVEVPHLVPADPKNEFGEPVFTLRIYNNPASPGDLKTTVAVDFCNAHVEPRHIISAIRTLHKFADDKNKESAK